MSDLMRMLTVDLSRRDSLSDLELHSSCGGFVNAAQRAELAWTRWIEFGEARGLRAHPLDLLVLWGQTVALVHGMDHFEGCEPGTSASWLANMITSGTRAGRHRSFGPGRLLRELHWRLKRQQERVTVEENVYNRPGEPGDYNFDLERTRRTLFVYNDDNLSHYSRDCTEYPIRAQNMFNQGWSLDEPLMGSPRNKWFTGAYPAPRSVGVCTGPDPLVARGYQNLKEPDRRWQLLDGTRDAISVINRDLLEVKELLSSGRFNRVRFSGDGHGNLGAASFQTGKDVSDHIVKYLNRFDGMTPQEIARMPDKEYLKEPRRHVGFAITVTHLQSINDKEQTFLVHFFLQMQWEAQSDSDRWFPYMIWKNSIDIRPVDEPDWTPCEGRAIKGQMITVRQHFVGEFSEPYELRRFPADYQKLHILIESDHAEKVVFGPMRLTPGKLDNNTLANWSVHKHVDRGTEVDVEFSETDTAGSALGNQYTTVVVRLFLSRKFSVWLYNVLLPLFVITSLVFCGFALEASMNNDRMAVFSALLLAIVAVKFTIAEKLPDMPYATALDYYMLFCMAVAALAMVCAALSELCAANDECDAVQVDSASVQALACLWIGGNVIAMSMLSMRKRFLRTGEWMGRDVGKGHWPKLDNPPANLQLTCKYLRWLSELPRVDKYGYLEDYFVASRPGKRSSYDQWCDWAERERCAIPAILSDLWHEIQAKWPHLIKLKHTNARETPTLRAGIPFIVENTEQDRTNRVGVALDDQPDTCNTAEDEQAEFLSSRKRSS